MRRSLVRALGWSALLVACFLAIVGLRVQQVHLAYRLDALRADRARTEKLIRQLEVQVATLRSPSRVESRARALGMTAPSRDQVHLAREYVAGTTGGMAAARLARIEALVP
ncbi:MAG: cell division protein FtsL [Candidatus Rokubacteria bacterium]|nr:cell division protein FtsL [Candidatus Rokubacteria bacterium]